MARLDDGCEVRFVDGFAGFTPVPSGGGSTTSRAYYQVARTAL